MKRFLAICALSALLLGIPISLETTKASSYSWMEPGNYFDYIIETMWVDPPSNETTNYSTIIIAVSLTTISFNESYSGGNLSMWRKDSFDLSTRESTNRTGYYSWLWINPEDLANGTVMVAKKQAAVYYENSTEVVLEISEESGNHSFLYYDKPTYLLRYTTDHVFLNQSEAYSETTRIGMGKLAGPGERVKESEPFQEISGDAGGVEPLQNEIRIYPPYANGDYGKKIERGWGVHWKDMYTDYSKSAGWVYTDGFAIAGPGLGYAYAYGAPWLDHHWYSPPESRYYRVKLHYTLDYIAFWGGTFCDWRGCSVTHTYIDAYGEMWERGASYPLKTDRYVHLDYWCIGGFCPPWGWTWSGAEFDLDLGRPWMSRYKDYQWYFYHRLEVYAFALGVALGYTFGWGYFTLDYISLQY